MSKHIIAEFEARRATLAAALDSVTAERRANGGHLSPVVEAEGRNYQTEIAELDKSIADLEANEARKDQVAEARASIGGWSVTRDELVYRGEAGGYSFFKDMHSARYGDAEAAERLTRSHRATMETRAADMTSSGATSGASFAPPDWLVNEYVNKARASAITASILHEEPMPKGVSSINLPAVSAASTGSAVAVQQTQGTSVTDVALSTTSLSSSISTLAGKITFSQQLFDQAGVPIDRVIFEDLTSAHGVALDGQVLYGSNSNAQLNGLVNGTNVIAYTTTQPSLMSVTSANSFYNKIIAAANAVNVGRFQPANAVVMHSNRWSWCLEALDSQSRAQITAGAPSTGYNVPAVSTEIRAEGSVGTLAGLPVYVDNNISLTANSSTNQDEVYVLRTDDVWLWRSQPMVQLFDQPFADSLVWLARIYSYAAQITRYAASVQVVRGTGLVVPTL